MRDRILHLSLLVCLIMLSSPIAFGADAPAPPANAQLTIITGGEPCRVYIDNVFVGDSALTVSVAAGKHKVRAVPETGEAKEQTVKAGANETTVVRFDFPLPKPVQEALKGGAKATEDEEFSISHLEFGIAAAAIIGGGVVLALNSNHHHIDNDASITVSQRNINVSVKSNLGTPDGDSINLYVNGAKMLDSYVLTGSDMVVAVSLSSGMNYIAIEAKNEGTTPPNTGTITISNVTDGNSTHTWSLTAGNTGYLDMEAP